MYLDRRTAPPPGQRRLPPPQVGGLPAELSPLADVVDRLFTDFAPHLELAAVVSTVRRCHRELDNIHPAPPELVERLARQRLHSITTERRERAKRRP